MTEPNETSENWESVERHCWQAPMKFYTDNKPEFLLNEARDYLAKRGVTILSFQEANEIAPVGVFDNVPTGRNFLSLPKLGRINTPIPYEPGEHEEIKIDGILLSDIVSRYVDRYFLKEKFIFSGRPDVFFAIAFYEFGYDIFSYIHSGHLTTPMILFDRSNSHVIFFEFDLAINTISRTQECSDDFVSGKTEDYWIKYFNEHFLDGISYNQYHVDLINKHYSPVISGLNVPSRAP